MTPSVTALHIALPLLLPFLPPRNPPAPTLNLEQQQINYYQPIIYFPYNFCVDRTLAGGTSKLTSQHLDKRTSTAFCAFLVN